MFKKSHPLQSKSEIILRNIVVILMVVFFSVFLVIPIGIAFAGSFHEWNPLSGTYYIYVQSPSASYQGVFDYVPVNERA